MTPPPIADPRAVEEKAPTKTPFRGLKVFIALSAVFSFALPLSSLYSPDPDGIRTLVFGILGVFMVLWALLLWRLWHGSNVARTIYWALSVLVTLKKIGSLREGLQHGPMPIRVDWLDYIFYACYAFLLFALVWLQLPGVRSHFRRDKPL